MSGGSQTSDRPNHRLSRHLRRALGISATLVMAGLVAGGCSRPQPESHGTAQIHEQPAHDQEAPEQLTPERTAPTIHTNPPSQVRSSAGAIGRQAGQAPPLADLVNSATSPFVQNPVSWRFERALLAPDGSIIGDVNLALTTTAERVVVDEGVLLRLVSEIQGPGPLAEAAGVEIEQEFRSLVGLLTPEGLYLSDPNSVEGALADQADSLVEQLRSEPVAWPLPGTEGCEGEERSFQMPLGVVSGLLTRCRDWESDRGPANVTTVWLDRVGFAYLEVRPTGRNTLVGQRDVLMGGDVAELASEGEGAGMPVPF